MYPYLSTRISLPYLLFIKLATSANTIDNVSNRNDAGLLSIVLQAKAYGTKNVSYLWMGVWL